MATEHTIDPTRIHHEWNASLEPTLRIESGDSVHFEVPIHDLGEPLTRFEVRAIGRP